MVLLFLLIGNALGDLGYGILAFGVSCSIHRYYEAFGRAINYGGAWGLEILVLCGWRAFFSGRKSALGWSN